MFTPVQIIEVEQKRTPQYTSISFYLYIWFDVQMRLKRENWPFSQVSGHFFLINLFW